MLGAVMSEVRGRGLTWRAGRPVAGRVPRPGGAVLGKASPPYRPSPASAPAPTCTRAFPPREGPWGARPGRCAGGRVCFPATAARARSGRVTLRTVGRSHISLVSRARVGRGGEEGARPLPKWLLPLLGGVRHRGEGREEAAAPPPPRLALLPGADRWKRRSVGRTPARGGGGRRLAHAGATWPRSRAAAALPTPTPGEFA